MGFMLLLELYLLLPVYEDYMRIILRIITILVMNRVSCIDTSLMLYDCFYTSVSTTEDRNNKGEYPTYRLRGSITKLIMKMTSMKNLFMYFIEEIRIELINSINNLINLLMEMLGFGQPQLAYCNGIDNDSAFVYIKRSRDEEDQYPSDGERSNKKVKTDDNIVMDQDIEPVMPKSENSEEESNNSEEKQSDNEPQSNNSEEKQSDNEPQSNNSVEQPINDTESNNPEENPEQGNNSEQEQESENNDQQSEDFYQEDSHSEDAPQDDGQQGDEEPERDYNDPNDPRNEWALDHPSQDSNSDDSGYLSPWGSHDDIGELEEKLAATRSAKAGDETATAYVKATFPEFFDEESNFETVEEALNAIEDMLTFDLNGELRDRSVSPESDADSNNNANSNNNTNSNNNANGENNTNSANNPGNPVSPDSTGNFEDEPNNPASPDSTGNFEDEPNNNVNPGSTGNPNGGNTNNQGPNQDSKIIDSGLDQNYIDSNSLETSGFANNYYFDLESYISMQALNEHLIYTIVFYILLVCAICWVSFILFTIYKVFNWLLQSFSKL